MVIKVIPLLERSFGACFDFMTRIFEGVAGTGLVLGMLTIFLVWRNILKPLFGDSGSDTVKKNKSKSKG